MAQATRKKFDSTPLTSQITRGIRESVLFVCAAIAIYLLVALLSYDQSDPGWSHTGGNLHANNVGGVAGAWFADIFLYLFGYLAYLFPVMVGYAGWLIFRARDDEGERYSPLQLALRGAGFVLTMAAGTGLANMHFADPNSLFPLGTGGILGDVTGDGLVTFFNFVGTTLFLVALFLTGVTLFTGLSWLRLMDTTGRFTFNGLALLYGAWLELRERFTRKPVEQVAPKPVKAKEIKRQAPRLEPVIDDMDPIDEAPPLRSTLKVLPPKARQMPLFEESLSAGLPPLSLLDEAVVSSTSVSRDALEAMSRRVESTLADFGIEVQVVSVEPGPVIARYEMKPAPGIKVSQITSLAKDLARALSVISVRVVEVIPGKPFIGLEIPNQHREIVRLREILKQKDPMSTSPLNLALGKDISGHPMSVDLARMPHLLVAGTTGSGKSVAINAMILSILYNASPKDVRMIMIDPKMLELSVYEGIPHLLAPVVTDMKEAANALRWCVAEMDKRYRLMSSLGVRNIAGYNRKVEDAIKNGKPLLDPLAKPVGEDEELPTLTPLPYIVVVVDELADMMMVVGKKVEELIARLAQKARASGIHLLLATQRPSVDVLTGLIKANIPTRISFQVSSKIDSRTILDQMGAEQLLGHGDMLYLAPGTGVPIRVHGAFVADHEVHRVVENLRGFGAPQYIDEVLQGESAAGGDYLGEDVDGEADELYDKAVRIVTETRRPSISSVQRRLKIGYNRAARMIEQMERAGVVGPLQSNGNREVLAPPPPQD